MNFRRGGGYCAKLLGSSFTFGGEVICSLLKIQEKFGEVY